MTGIEHSEFEKPIIDYTLCDDGRLEPEQYKAVIDYLLRVNQQLEKWNGLPRLSERYKKLREEALDVFNSLSAADLQRATRRLVNSGLELMMI